METTVSMWQAIDGEVLDIENTVVLNVMSIEDDGIFQNEQEWKDFLDQVDRYGSYYLAENWVYNEDGSCDVSGNVVTFEFNNPIKVLTGYSINNGEKTPVISEVKGMKMEIDYEWSFLNKYLDLGYATMIDIEGRVLDVY